MRLLIGAKLLFVVVLGTGCTAFDGLFRSGDAFAWIDAEDSPVLAAEALPPESTGSDEDDPFISPAGLPTGQVIIKGNTFQVEIAATHDARMTGLMGRESLAPDAGMLFVFEQPERLSFWMRNTLIPLDIAFIRADGTIESIDSMEPQTLVSHRSGEPVPLALEVPAGTFERLGIEPDDPVTILGTLPY